MKKAILISIILVVLIFAALAEHFVGDSFISSITDFLKDYRDRLGPLAPVVFIALQVLQVLIAPIPGQLTGVIGGNLFGAFWGTVYSLIGLTIGSFLAIWLARAFGRRFVERFVKPDDLAKFDHLAEKSGLPVFFLIFLLPALPDDAICFIAGLTKLPIPALVLMAFLGRLPGLLFLSLAGEQIESFAWLIVAVIVVFAGLFIIFRPHIEAFFTRRKSSQVTPADKHKDVETELTTE